MAHSHDFEAFAAYFASQYVRTRGFAYGCSLLFLNEDGVQHRCQFGRDDEDAVYCCFSMTKIVTTIACLQLRDRGLLSLDDPVVKFLPSFRAKRALDDGAGGVAASTITVRHCLNHTSGLSYYFFDPVGITSAVEKEAAKHTYVDLDSGKDVATLVDEFWSTAPALFEAGEHYSYSPGHDVVAAIIGVLTGQDMQAYFEEHILGPLQMRDTAYLLSEPLRQRLVKQQPIEIAQVGVPRWSTWLMPALPLSFRDLHFDRTRLRGDSGLKGTAADWARLNLCLLNGGTLDGVRVLSDASVAEMASSSVGGRLLEPPFGFQGGVSDAQYTSPPTAPAFRVSEADQFHCRPFNYFPGQTAGLGVLVVDQPERATLVPSARGTAWWCGSASTYFGFNPSAKVGVVLMGHQMPTSHMRTLAFRDALNAAHVLLLGTADALPHHAWCRTRWPRSRAALAALVEHRLPLLASAALVAALGLVGARLGARRLVAF
jgi:CubicO group peptidase (beta-lactamase class C family)